MGLCLALFLILFSISGIILNHRKAVSGIDLSRRVLSGDFHYHDWNNASAKGSVKLSPDSILLYGGSGIWLINPHTNSVTDFTQGLKSGADNRITNRIVQTADKEVYAVTTFDLYKLVAGRWEVQTDKPGIDERISDMAFHNDTLAVLTRSHLYYSVAPFTHFRKVEIAAPDGYEAKTSVFRTLWLLHSGKLFGTVGQLVVDIIGVMLIVVSVTGVLYFFFPKLLKRRKKKGLSIDGVRNATRRSIRWHNKVGVVCLLFFLLITLTGMFLRPPMMITIIRSKITNPKGTILNSPNPWNDKLRTIRYDERRQEWLIYSSEGFFALDNFTDTPRKITFAPPVSVMGVTVMEPAPHGWLVGSFNGLFYWDRDHDKIVNCYTGMPVTGPVRGRPVSDHPVSGYSGDFDGHIVFEYSKGTVVFDSGTPFLPMPDELGAGRISLYHAALEVHTGRAYCYLLGLSGDLYTFTFGLLILILLISGFFIYRKKYRKKAASKPVQGDEQRGQQEQEADNNHH